MADKQKSIVVVLGMHRSGTSVIARSLQVFGVDLGSRLMAPQTGVNEKGFFEDIDLNQINVELLHALDQDWHTFTLVEEEALRSEKLEHLKARAIKLLQSRVKKAEYFGLKDPRMCRLLPFWQGVFRQLKLCSLYVIALRDPLSVAESLQRVHNLPPEKSHYLWLAHILPSVRLTADSPRVVVNYDCLLSNPEKQLRRIAGCLGLLEKMDAERMEEFKKEFLDRGLRSASHSVKTVLREPEVPAPVKTAFKVLDDVSQGRRNLNTKRVIKTFDGLSNQLDGMKQAMGYLDTLDDRIESLTRDHDGLVVRVEMLDAEARKRDKQIKSLSRNLASDRARIGKLSKESEARGIRLEELKVQLQEQKEKSESQSEQLARRDKQLNSLNREILDANNELSKVKQELVLRNRKNDELEQSAQDKDKLIQKIGVASVEANFRLQQARKTLGSRLARPLRVLRHLLNNLGLKRKLHLVPFNQLKAHENEWIATGTDPQFLIFADKRWNQLYGWWWLVVDFEVSQPITAQLYIDGGDGFHPSRVITVQLSGKGRKCIPIYIPSTCEAIRLDPCDRPSTFSLSLWGLKRLMKAPEFSPEFRSQLSVYQLLGGSAGDSVSFTPLNCVKYLGNDEYAWESTGNDPWFLLSGLENKLRPGWYSIEIRIRANVPRGTARLYFDYGNGFSESASTALPFDSEQMTQRLYLLTAVPKRIRLDPIEQPAKFSVAYLQFSPVTVVSARGSLLKRLMDRSAQFEGMDEAEILRKLEDKAKTENKSCEQLLYEAYDHTFQAEIVGSTIGRAYAEWIEEYEAPGLAHLDKVFKVKPKISIMMPVYNTPIKFLQRAIDSVLRQSYPHWELCIADDASSEPKIADVLESYRKFDQRIKVTFREKNGHISAASNSALELASGDFVALLDHDDELSEHALYFIVETVNKRPSVQVIYSDEDKIDDKGRRTDPHFKPDWSPDTFFSQNYVSHLGVYRRTLLEKISGFRVGFEGCQDQDLFLRCLPHIESEEIAHIPRVLYHWRIVEGSAALGSDQKPYTTGVGVRALQDYFSKKGSNGVKVEPGLVPNTYRVRYALPASEPLVSLLIPTRDKLEILEPCVQSILEKTTYQNYEILVIDNQSIEPATLEFFERVQNDDARIRVISFEQPFNFSAINNFGVKHANGEVIGLINNDIEVISPQWLTEMVSHALRPEIGCVGAKLYYPDDTIQHGGVIVGLGGVAGHSHKHYPREAPGYFYRLKIIQNYSAVTAACLVIRKSIYEQVGGLEEKGLGVAFNDVDLCLKVRQAGYRNLWTPYAELYHHESKSRGAEHTKEKLERFNNEIEFMRKKWGERLQIDPCYSQNLTLAREDFSLR